MILYKMTNNVCKAELIVLLCLFLVVLVVSRGRTANGFQTISETSALDRAIEPLLNGNLVIENDDDTCYKWGEL